MARFCNALSFKMNFRTNPVTVNCDSPVGLSTFIFSPGSGAVHSFDPSGHMHLQFWSTNPPRMHFTFFGQWAEIRINYK